MLVLTWCPMAGPDIPELDLSVLDGADHKLRTMETVLMKTWPGAVPAEHVQQWLAAAEQMLEETPAQAPAGCDSQQWTDTRRSAARDVQAAKGWLDRAHSSSGEQRLTDRLTQMGWQGSTEDQPAWTAMEQSARAILQCRELAEEAAKNA